MVFFPPLLFSRYLMMMSSNFVHHGDMTINFLVTLPLRTARKLRKIMLN